MMVAFHHWFAVEISLEKLFHKPSFCPIPALETVSQHDHWCRYFTYQNIHGHSFSYSTVPRFRIGHDNTPTPERIGQIKVKKELGTVFLTGTQTMSQRESHSA